jgi:hypothetical protein
MTRLLPLVLGLSLALVPRTATASDDAVVRAREQFRDGVALMAAKDWSGALAKFKSVAQVKMTPQVAFNIAECEENLGKLVSALGNYRLALAQSADGSAPQVASTAPERIAAIEPRIASLTLKRTEEAPNPNATIELDGAEVSQAQLGTAIPVDPGARSVRVMVGGRPVKSETVTLKEGQKKTFEIVVPGPAIGEGPGPEGPATGPEVATGPSAPGIALTVVGGASLVVGFVMIGLRQGAISDLDELCGGDTSCPPSAQDTYDSGRLYTGLAEVTIPVGAIGLGIGIALLATGVGAPHGPAPSDAPSDAPPAPEVTGFAPGADLGGVSLVGRF